MRNRTKIGFAGINHIPTPAASQRWNDPKTVLFRPQGMQTARVTKIAQKQLGSSAVGPDRLNAQAIETATDRHCGTVPITPLKNR
ncbi:hypothetical protein Poly24_34590 [Rosistilla carotiformis]|uniref:Uncharacterized protein n=1 Tax=Rosistilla carotiformis TaxID=2528017 RepID=A0A518JW27_9BACT|nr:hypothetical protein Poly24_34590 [Rosistilla carotiformis]